MSAPTGPVWARKPDARREALEAYTGQVCIVRTSGMRDANALRAAAGLVLGVAHANGPDLLIIRQTGGRLVALSTATVHSLEPA